MHQKIINKPVMLPLKSILSEVSYRWVNFRLPQLKLNRDVICVKKCITCCSHEFCRLLLSSHQGCRLCICKIFQQSRHKIRELLFPLKRISVFLQKLFCTSRCFLQGLAENVCPQPAEKGSNGRIHGR